MFHVFLRKSKNLLIWEKTYGGSQGDNIHRIFPDGNGGYYLLGASNSSDGDISYDPYPGTWDYWIIKIDNSGNILWEKIVGGNGDDVYELYDGSSVVDIYGEVGVDGTGEDWEYLDAIAYRN